MPQFRRGDPRGSEFGRSAFENGAVREEVFDIIDRERRNGITDTRMDVEVPVPDEPRQRLP